MTAKIQQKNQTVDEQCAELQAKLSADGLRSCILKGQGVASLYSEHLLGLRQSGDIDIWIEGGVEAVVKLAEILGQKADVTEQHVHLDLFEDTEVEAHFTPSVLKSPWANRRLQKWFEEQATTQFEHRNEAGLCVPNDEFNLVFLLIHVYRHLFGEGVGMRQVMDYYFALMHSGAEDKRKAMVMIERIGLGKFAAGMMWMLERVFGLQRADMLCEPNERHGTFLLNEVLLSGNMGHYDERTKNADRSSRWKRFWLMNRHNFRLFSYYPAETLWAPWSRVRYWVWRKWNGWI